MPIRHLFLLLTLTAFFLSVVKGGITADEGLTPEENRIRFQLFAHCQPMVPFMRDLSPDAAKIGLSRDSIVAAVESRLRSARLVSFDDEEWAPRLQIEVGVVGNTFSLNLLYAKWFFDPLYGLVSYAVTWQHTGLGGHGGDAGYVISALSQKLDKFLADYLRVNEAACEKR